MKTKLLLLGLGAAGIYFLDAKKGKKRRATFEKNFKNVISQAEGYCSELAERSKPLLKDLSERGKPYLETLGREGQRYASEAGESLKNYTKNGGPNWNPSARLTGATAGALALYGAGRRGFTGALLRTLSLGFFTRALLASK